MYPLPQPMTRSSIWNGIVRMAEISHSLTSNNQRTLQKAQAYTSEFAGDPNGFLPGSIEDIHHSDFQVALVKNFEKATGLVVAVNA